MSHIDTGMESDSGRLIGIILVTEKFQCVDATFVHRMIWSNDSASPGAHKYIIAIIHTIANCAISNAFLTPLKLLKESEVPGNDYRTAGIHLRSPYRLCSALVPFKT